MTKFDDRDFDLLQKLCQISCSEEEKTKLLTNISRVLEYIGQLDEVNTEEVPSCKYILSNMQKNITRDDLVGSTLPREEFLANAPSHIGGLIRVPPVQK